MKGVYDGRVDRVFLFTAKPGYIRVQDVDRTFSLTARRSKKPGFVRVKFVKKAVNAPPSFLSSSSASSSDSPSSSPLLYDRLVFSDFQPSPEAGSEEKQKQAEEVVVVPGLILFPFSFSAEISASFPEGNPGAVRRFLESVFRIILEELGDPL